MSNSNSSAHSPFKRGVQLTIGGLALGIPLFPFLWGASVWPSGDFDGHIATIELYRGSLARGAFWPYDYHAGLGNDAVPFYGWYFELLCGFIALCLSRVVPPDAAATIVAVTVGVAALVVLQWIFAEALELKNSSWCLPALLLAALFACLPSDTFTPNGGSMIFDFGMLTGFVGLVLLVWLTVLLQRYEQVGDNEFRRVIPFLFAAIIGTHPLSAFLAGVLAGLSGVALLITRRLLKCWRLVQFIFVAFLLSAPCVHALFATHTQHNSFIDETAPAGLSLIGAILSLRGAWRFPLALLLSIVLFSSIWDRKSLFFRGGVFFSLLPLSGVLPLLSPGVHAYRLLPFGSALLLIAGMRALAAWFDHRPRWIPWIQPFLAVSFIYCLLLWCLPRMLPALAVEMHQQFLSSFESVYQHSFSRVIVADDHDYKAPFFRHGVELAAHLSDFESGNSFHWLKGSESLAPLSAAIWSLGGRVWYPRFVYESSHVPREQAISILRYYGIDDVYLPEDRMVHPTVLSHIHIETPEDVLKIIPLRALAVLPGSSVAHGFARHHEAYDRMMLSPDSFDVGYVRQLPQEAASSPVVGISGLTEDFGGISLPVRAADIVRPRVTVRSYTSFRIEGLIPGQPYLLKYSFSPYWEWSNAHSVEELSGMTVIVPHAKEIFATFKRFTAQGFHLSFLLACLTALMLAGYAPIFKWIRQDR